MFSGERINNFWYAFVETAQAVGEAVVDELRNQSYSTGSLAAVVVNATLFITSGYNKFARNEGPNIIDLAPVLISCLYSFCSIKDACDKVSQEIPTNHERHATYALHIRDSLQSTKRKVENAQCIIAILAIALYMRGSLKPSVPLKIGAFLFDTAVILTQTIISNNTVADLHNMVITCSHHFHGNRRPNPIRNHFSLFQPPHNTSVIPVAPVLAFVQ